MGRPALSQVILRYIPEASTRAAALQSGDVDFITTILPDQVEQVASVEGLIVDQANVLNFMLVLFNTKIPPLNNVDLRRALSLAIDRDVLVNELWSGRTRVMNDYLMPNEFAYDPAAQLFPYDPEAAMRALEAAGYMGEPVPFISPGDYYTNARIVTDAIAAFWQAIGVNVDYQVVETAGWSDNLRGGGPGATIVSAGSSGDPGTSSILEGWFGGNFADDLYTPSAEYTRVWEAANAALDRDERQTLFRRLFEIIDADLPMAPLYQSVEFYGRRADIQWTPSTRFAIDLRPDLFQLG
jgi:peptide/nickel transport system substrate-binding protein